MTDQEILQAMQKMFEGLHSEMHQLNQKIDKVDQKVDGVRLLVDTDMRREINLLHEGHTAILERLPDSDNMEAMEARLTAIEAVMKIHSKDIQALKKAQ